MNKKNQTITRLLPFFLAASLVYFFWRQSILLLFFYISIVAIEIFFGRDRIAEIKMVAGGILWGIILEIIGVTSGYHTFNNPDFMGIPLWLGIFWGYGFLIAKRIGLIVFTGSPFKNK